jgi:hypothetical protein
MNPVQGAAQQIDPQEQIQQNIMQGAALKKKKTQEVDYTPSAISQAAAVLSPNSKDPQAQIGKAIATPNYAGYCLKWVDDQQGNQNRQPTAIADYQARSQAGQIQTGDKIPDNARVYFNADPSNGNMGHVGIYNAKSDTFTSATDNGVKSFSIPAWEKYTGQSMIGWSK